ALRGEAAGRRSGSAPHGRGHAGGGRAPAGQRLMNARAHAPRSAEEPRVILALLGLLAAAGLYAFLQSPFFALADIRVEGWRTVPPEEVVALRDRKSTRLNSSHVK